MAEPMNILDARNNLSRLVSAAAQGTDTVIAKRGRPVARITAVEQAVEQSARAVAEWIEALPPLSESRSKEQLDAQIDDERRGWE